MATKSKTASNPKNAGKAKPAMSARKPAAPKAKAAPIPAQTAAAVAPETPKAAVVAPVAAPEPEMAAAAAIETAEALESLATEAIGKAEAAMIETVAEMEATATAATEATVEKVEQAVSLAAVQTDKAIAAAGKGFEDATKAGESAFGTLLESGSSLAKGFEALNKEMLSYAQSAFDANLATARAIMGCGSVGEAMSIQMRHAQASLESLVAESSKVGSIASSAWSEAWAPMNAQLKSGLSRAWTTRAA